MIENYYIQLYVRIAYLILTRNQELKHFLQFEDRYCTQITDVVNSSQLPITNLIISWYYMYKYQDNTMCLLSIEDNISVVRDMILISLVLANKTFDDQCYSCTTWCNIINSSLGKNSFTVKLANQLEAHFLSVVDYRLSFANIDSPVFWTFLHNQFMLSGASRTTSTWLQQHISQPYIAPSLPGTPSITEILATPPTTAPKLPLTPLTPLTPFIAERKRTLYTMQSDTTEKVFPNVNLDLLSNYQFDFTIPC